MDDVLQAIVEESARAHGKYGPPTSAHESLGVLLEEFEELRAAIHLNLASAVAKEAVQVASVAYRLALACQRGELAFYARSGFAGK